MGVLELDISQLPSWSTGDSETLLCIAKKNPESVTDLAGKLNRRVDAVCAQLRRFRKIGLVGQETTGRVKKPKLLASAICIRICQDSFESGPANSAPKIGKRGRPRKANAGVASVVVEPPAANLANSGQAA